MSWLYLPELAVASLSLGKSNPIRFSLRTCQAYFSIPISEPFWQTYKRLATTSRGRSSLRRRMSEHRTGGKGSGLWPTPTRASADKEVVNSHRGANIVAVAKQMWATPRSTDGSHGGRVTPRKSKEGGNLIEAVAARNFPTPSSRDWKSSNASQETMNRNSRPLNETVTQGAGGHLNPEWVEWLMGWPISWTSLAPLPKEHFDDWKAKHRQTAGAEEA